MDKTVLILTPQKCLQQRNYRYTGLRPFHERGLTLITAWASNHIYTYYKYGVRLLICTQNLGMDTKRRPTLSWGCDYLSMLGLEGKKPTNLTMPSPPSSNFREEFVLIVQIFLFLQYDTSPLLVCCYH